MHLICYSYLCKYKLCMENLMLMFIEVGWIKSDYRDNDKRSASPNSHGDRQRHSPNGPFCKYMAAEAQQLSSRVSLISVAKFQFCLCIQEQNIFKLLRHLSGTLQNRPWFKFPDILSDSNCLFFRKPGDKISPKIRKQTVDTTYKAYSDYGP